MATVSRESTETVEDQGVVVSRGTVVDDIKVEFVTFNEAVDATPLLASLPDGLCPCPHWGYVIAGGGTLRYADGEDHFEAGDAFYWTPGHVPALRAGTQLLMFSPAEEVAVVEDAIKSAMAAG